MKDTLALVKKTYTAEIGPNEIPMGHVSAFELFSHGETDALPRFQKSIMKELLVGNARVLS
ncbi:MAG: hypothetical protein WD423_16685 [Rhodothermales bacterium]